MKVFLEDISIWIAELGRKQMVALPKVGGHHPVLWGPEQNKKAEKVEFTFCLSAELRHGSSSALSAPESIDSQAVRLESTSPALRRSDLQRDRCSLCISACRQQTLGLLSLSIHMTQYLMINLSISRTPTKTAPKLEKISIACFTLTGRVAGQELYPSSSGSKSRILPRHCVMGNVHCIMRAWGPPVVSRASRPHSPREHCLLLIHQAARGLRPLGIQTFPSPWQFTQLLHKQPCPLHCENSLSVQQPLKFLISGLKWVKCRWQTAH